MNAGNFYRQSHPEKTKEEKEQEEPGSVEPSRISANSTVQNGDSASSC